jgi:hypothetical protein
MGLHWRHLHMLTYSDEEHAKTDENTGIDKNARRLCCARHKEGGFARGCSRSIRTGLSDSSVTASSRVRIYVRRYTYCMYARQTCLSVTQGLPRRSIGRSEKQVHRQSCSSASQMTDPLLLLLLCIVSSQYPINHSCCTEKCTIVNPFSFSSV